MTTKNSRSDTLPGRFGVGIQARIDSTRLPRKALLPLAGEPSLVHALRRLALVPADFHAILTDEESFGEFSLIGEKEGFLVIKGSKNDVLSRYTGFIRDFKLDFVLRATGDNPLVFVDHLPRLMKKFLEDEGDYGATVDLPYGAGVELVRGSALLRAEAEAKDRRDREHVCTYLYEADRGFSQVLVPADLEYSGSHFRLTLDTPEDYLFLQTLFDESTLAKPGSDLLIMDYLRARV